jgi:hypothetical protein
VCACREYEAKTENEIKVDRYNKFRKLGEYRDFIVKGGKWEEAEARRASMPGVLSKTGRWAEVRPFALLMFFLVSLDFLIPSMDMFKNGENPKRPSNGGHSFAVLASRDVLTGLQHTT